MKKIIWMTLFLFIALGGAWACCPFMKSNNKSIHSDSQKAQQALDQSIQNHP